MRIAYLNVIRPQEGSGDGTTEYAYRLIKQISKRKGVKTDVICALEKSQKNNVSGLVYTFTLFKRKLGKINFDEYDIVHLTSQEIGFAAKLLKRAGFRGKIITTVHDTARFRDGLQKGVKQHVYNRLVRSSVRQAAQYSDYLLFDSAITKKYFERRLDFGRSSSVVNLGIREAFRAAYARKTLKKQFVVGYIGALASHKNVFFILDTASRLLYEQDIQFKIYGAGPEYKALLTYKKSNGLDNVTFCGFAKEASIVKTYDSFDVFIFPTLYEGFGLPILEAQARGLPVIVYRKGVVPSEVKRYSLLASNPGQAADIIKRLRRSKHAPRSKKATAYARGFTWEKAANKTFSIYRKLYAEKR